jgi:hypothetical protein
MLVIVTADCIAIIKRFLDKLKSTALHSYWKKSGMKQSMNGKDSLTNMIE